MIPPLPFAKKSSVWQKEEELRKVKWSGAAGSGGSAGAGVLGGGAGSSEVCAVACDDYRLDMSAAIFGACKCGFPKAAHS